MGWERINTDKEQFQMVTLIQDERETNIAVLGTDGAFETSNSAK